ncbi:Gfo/Idh/MocA family protein [Seonamhaeicola maritimus]|uniref:Gfo/Idh/MocA family protein n=1 Tax=Seonamhaeicola maritimus TaxID=2591822 RepID=UPI0031E5F9E0
MLKLLLGGYFNDLASHGLDLFCYLIGNIKNAQGFSNNQQSFYDATDAVTASWIHENGITGTGIWNFGSHSHLDEVTIFGSKGKIEFPIFHDNPLILRSESKNESIFIENPNHIQQYHVEGMRDELILKNYKHPSTGASGLHTNWIMDKILGTL